MDFKLKVKAINGKDFDVKITIYIDGLLKINSGSEITNDTIPVAVNSFVLEKFNKFLDEVYSELNLDSFNYKLVSKSLDSLKTKHLIPDATNLQQIILELLKKSLCDALKVEYFDNDDKMIPLLKEKKDLFKQIFLETNSKSKNKDLIRAMDLLEEKKYADSFILLNSVDKKSLDNNEEFEYSILTFKLLIKNSDKKIETMFEDLVKKYENSPSFVKQFYFVYIKYLESTRDTKKPRKLLKEFENRYPVSILNDAEFATYYLLKGHTEYGRGEFLDALKYFSLSLAKADKNDKKFVASIYNSSTNSFSDNLFFDEARYIASEALSRRELLNLPEKQETISLLGGIEFKSGNFEKAYGLYLDSEILANNYTLTEREKNRLYNYIAKSAIMLEKYDVAEKYLNLAQKGNDKNGFSQLIMMLLMLKKKDYEGMFSLYEKTLMLPENHDAYDKFVLGWGYTLMAQASLEQKAYKDGIVFLNQATVFFIDDLYFLEAMYVSLYLYSYKVPKKYIKMFRKIEDKYSIKNQFRKYVEKHSIISKKYFNNFIEDKYDCKESILIDFYNVIEDINDNNFNPEEVKGILETICLI